MLNIMSMLYEVFIFRKEKKLLYSIDPRIKMVQLFVLLTTVLLTPHVWAQIILVTYLILLSIVGANLRRILRSFKEIYKLLILFYIIIYIFNVYPRIIDFNVAYQAFLAIFRLFLLIYSFTLFFTTTQLDDLAQALYKIKVPFHIAYTLTLSVRFIPTVAKDLLTVYDAQRARGLELERGSFIERLRKIIPLLIPAFIISILRVDYVAEALESRVFGAAKKRTFIYELKITIKDVSFLFLSTIPLFAIYFYFNILS